MKKTLLLLFALMASLSGAWAQEPTNLALTGTASASYANGDAHLSNDGNGGTRWGSNGGTDTEWYQIAWESAQTFNTVKILCEGAMNAANAPHLAFDIQVSNDGTNWTNKKHIWGQNADGGQYLTIVFNEPATAQYIRFQGVKKGQYGYSFWEFEVYNIDYSAKALNSITLSSYLNETSTNAGRSIALSVVGKTADEEVIPTGAITWNNTASSVGTVADETFHSLTSGETTISATAGGKTSAEITFTVTAPQVLGRVELPYRFWSATQGAGGVVASVYDTEGDAFEGDVTLSWDGNAPVGAVINGKNIEFGAASGAGTYTLKATDGITNVTTTINMIGTDPEDPTADASDVLAIYSGKYGTETYDGWATNWEWGYGRRDIVAINSNNCVRIHNVGTYGFPYPDADLTQYTTLKFDIYTTEATTGFVRIEKTNINNMAFSTTAGAWKTVEIDLTGLAVADGNRWIHINVGSSSTDKNRDVLIDNVYFENEIPVVPTTSITVTAPAATVAIGKTLQLTVKNQGNNTLDPSGITFESSDETKATVGVDGVVTGVAEGDVTITATVKGSDPAISNTIDLTVVPAPAGLELTAGGHTILVQGKHFVNLDENNWQVVITSTDDLSGLGGSFWTLSSGGTDMRTNLSISGDKKTMTITATSTSTPSMYTPLYVNMPGEINFCEGSYFNSNIKWVEFVSITPAYEKTTYVTTEKLDFTKVDGLDAYVATSANASSVTMTKVEAAVPAGTPLMLIGTAGTQYNVPVAATAEAVVGNLLVAGDGSTTIGGTLRYDYILYSDGLFYRANEGVLAVGKAYLHLDAAPAAGAHALNIVFDDGDVTGINLTPALSQSNGVYFDLMGRKIAQPTKGLYIVNGRKVVIK